jgi:hypothetical protein
VSAAPNEWVVTCFEHWRSICLSLTMIMLHFVYTKTLLFGPKPRICKDNAMFSAPVRGHRGRYLALTSLSGYAPTTSYCDVYHYPLVTGAALGPFAV